MYNNILALQKDKLSVKWHLEEVCFNLFKYIVGGEETTFAQESQLLSEGWIKNELQTHFSQHQMFWTLQSGRTWANVPHQYK